MILTRLKLEHFRNYTRLDLPLSSGPTVLYGPNGAGKTNILEAIFALATTRSFRSRSDAELIDRRLDSTEVPYRFARLEGDAAGENHTVRIEMLIAAERKERSDGAASRKRFRLDGVPRRGADVVGQIKSVLFAPSDLDMVTGSPTLRRRFIDLMLCQIDRSYLRLLQTYGQIVQRRNAVLTNLLPRTDPNVLDFWDQKLVEEGSEIVRRRSTMMGQLSDLARRMYTDISGDAEEFGVVYRPNIGALEDVSDVDATFLDRLKAESRRSREQKVTLVGPHRDDMDLLIDGVSLQGFGSRGQQRTAALSLRMAEAKFISSQTGEQPILLLDEALAELDDSRRGYLLEFVAEYPQVLLTGTTATVYSEEFQSTCHMIRIEDGAVVS